MNKHVAAAITRRSFLNTGAAFVGGGQKDTLNALAEVVNKNGGIQNHKLVFSFHDDQSSPQVAVQLSNDVLASKPAVAHTG